MEKTDSSSASAFFEKYGTALAVLAGALIIGAAFAFGQGGEPRKTNNGEPVAVNITDVNTDSNPAVGPKNAKATIAVWFDFQCRFCKQFETTTLKQVIETYGNDVRVVYKDFQFMGAASNNAALYSRALYEAYPNEWGAWILGVMSNEGESTLDTAGLDAVASGLGLDTARVAELRSSKAAEYQKAIDADREEGIAFGINGTPGSIIGTSLVSGAQSFDNVKALIDAELAK